MTAAVRERQSRHGQDDMIVSHRAAPARTGTRAGSGTRARSGATQTRSIRKASTRPKLRVLNQQAIRQRARRRNALLTLFIVVLCGFFAVALIQAQLVADQQDLDVLRARIAEAEADNAKMARDIELASSPAAIVDRATEFGMVRAYQPVYLQAVAPIRDVPNAPVFNPTPENRFTLAAPQAASANTVTAGLSSTAAVVPADVQIATGTTTGPAPAPADSNSNSNSGSDSATAQGPLGATADTGQPIDRGQTSPIVGTQVSADQGPAGATVVSGAVVSGAVASGTDDGAVEAAAVEAAGVEVAAVEVDAGSRFAGTRAVTGGPGSG